MDNLKIWLERLQNPGSYYELLDCPGFCNDRERLLAAVRAATRFLHPYENHKTGEIVRRARSLQLLCATAGHTFSDDAKWRDYDEQLKLRLRDEYFAQAPNSDVRKWLTDNRRVALDRVDDIALFIVASNRPGSPVDTPNTSTSPVQDISGDNGSQTSPPLRVGPPPLPKGPPSSHKPPPLPPRGQSKSTRNHNSVDPAETTIVLNAVTMTVSSQPASPKSARQSSEPTSSPPPMSGGEPAMAIQQNDHSIPTVLSTTMGKREKMALWLSGVFVAMAVVGIIVLLSLGQSPRKSIPRKQTSQTESSHREQRELGHPSLAMIPSRDANRKDR